MWVYLRACGATGPSTTTGALQTGLSPRMRSNLPGASTVFQAVGSISAHAEQPTRHGRRDAPHGVYLRACGATDPVMGATPTSWGLSPRMRSNRRLGDGCAGRRGSISAHAEQPGTADPRRTVARVYLRACGATFAGLAAARGVAGLSPRMRSNLLRARARGPGQGSISAHAEQPRHCTSAADIRRVYLRACGATRAELVDGTSKTGLSPRMRSNLAKVIERHGHTGSISAHAEQPRMVISPGQPARVYLRACGATATRRSPAMAGTGLSPRMRSNPIWNAPLEIANGSISAHAEQPPGSG